MNKSIFLFFLFCKTTGLLAQSIPGDSVLANERSIDRPVTLHAQQFRISGSYDISVISKRFANNGDAIKLRDDGLSSGRHRFTLDMKYGLTDFIQFTGALAQSSHVIREQTRYIFPRNPEPAVIQQKVLNYSGLEDLFVAVDLRAPLKTPKIDLALTLGAYLPVSSSEPHKPDHSLEYVQKDDSQVNKFTYRYHYPLGKGTTVAQLGGMFKYRRAQWAVSARVDYQHALKDVKGFEWRHQLTADNTFEYRKDPFTYRFPDSFSFHTEGEYQPLPWFDTFLNISGYSSSGGWTSPQRDLRVALPDQLMIAVSTGFEILVTSKLWLRERINYTVTGKNYEAPFGVTTSLLYNFFPFN
jgi:hypothetical protein